MPNAAKDDPDAQHELLDSLNDKYDASPSFDACLNAHGMYETMRFVLRLSPRNHELMSTIEDSGLDDKGVSSEVLQAYSTYIHETIHWWQHVGSTSGLLFSLSYLAQVHSSLDELRDVLAKFGPKKPLKGWTDKVLSSEGAKAQAKLQSANIAVNNAVDVEFYKLFAYDPRKNSDWMKEQKHFESVGHGYFIVYGQLLGMIAGVIDPDFKAVSNAENWEAEIQRLRDQKCEGFYWGSPIRLPAVGMRAVYEGQAHFNQLQFLDGAQERTFSCQEWRDRGYLFGIYVEAFEAFLKITETDWPEKISDPVVALFLLVCDLAINPTRGVPIEIEIFEDFIHDVDVGLRFTRLCFAVKALPHLKQAIKDHSKEDYISIAGELVQRAGYDHPLTALQEILKWEQTAPGLRSLMDEHRTFEFDQTNLPIRVFVSHFISFSNDRYSHPEFFCWPGRHMAGASVKAESREIWLRHLSLFSDRGEKTGVYPRKWPDRDEAAIMKTFNRFYGSMALYDLTRQWILQDGPFVCDFRWLSENYSQEHADAWGNDTFKLTYGFGLDEFDIVQ